MEYYFFDLLQPKALSFDKYFRVYYTENGFFFYKIGGQFYSDSSFDSQMGGNLIASIIMYPVYILSQKRQTKATKKIEEIVENGLIEKAVFKKGNFFLAAKDIDKTVIKEASSFHTSNNDNGMLFFYMKDGKKFKFIIPRPILRKNVIEIFKVNYSDIPMEYIKKNGF
ncbi:hypothetical protein BACCIP111895_00909 [Neobacillus rhizosphaerae]|uniref:Uncharacterized protein n=1 Tax=Neobacillus rhizosphaerae TaxID=2880965 RepID=A0ABM9EME5_9BACI|nr:hypothetical protein [Neobacillus rhizosphaerae]CAH2713755.1 hypothetical protein BACCIP111895_00909 [Neobacillus rhizosphaerae]